VYGDDGLVALAVAGGDGVEETLAGQAGTWAASEENLALLSPTPLLGEWT
jgi:hypothetical protein